VYHASSKFSINSVIGLVLNTQSSKQECNMQACVSMLHHTLIYQESNLATCCLGREWPYSDLLTYYCISSVPSFKRIALYSAFKRSLQRVNLNEFLTVYEFSDMYDCV